jgi:hypothetical protein
MSNYISSFNETHKGRYVFTGIQQSENTVESRLGKVVQVRKEAGAFGSDIVLLRHSDDSLTSHENQSFYLIPKEFYSYLDAFFEGVCEDDADTQEYTLCKKQPEKGFIVPSKIASNEITPMRQIKEAILVSLS